MYHYISLLLFKLWSFFFFLKVTTLSNKKKVAKKITKTNKISARKKTIKADREIKDSKAKDSKTKENNIKSSDLTIIIGKPKTKYSSIKKCLLDLNLPVDSSNKKNREMLHYAENFYDIEVHPKKGVTIAPKVKTKLEIEKKNLKDKLNIDGDNIKVYSPQPEKMTFYKRSKNRKATVKVYPETLEKYPMQETLKFGYEEDYFHPITYDLNKNIYKQIGFDNYIWYILMHTIQSVDLDIQSNQISNFEGYSYVKNKSEIYPACFFHSYLVQILLHTGDDYEEWDIYDCLDKRVITRLNQYIRELKDKVDVSIQKACKLGYFQVICRYEYYAENDESKTVVFTDTDYLDKDKTVLIKNKSLVYQAEQEYFNSINDSKRKTLTYIMKDDEKRENYYKTRANILKTEFGYKLKTSCLYLRRLENYSDLWGLELYPELDIDENLKILLFLTHFFCVFRAKCKNSLNLDRIYMESNLYRPQLKQLYMQVFDNTENMLNQYFRPCVYPIDDRYKFEFSKIFNFDTYDDFERYQQYQEDYYSYIEEHSEELEELNGDIKNEPSVDDIPINSLYSQLDYIVNSKPFYYPYDGKKEYNWYKLSNIDSEILKSIKQKLENNLKVLQEINSQEDDSKEE